MKTTSDYSSLSHSRWDCKYYIVFVSKYRKEKLYGKIRNFLKSTFHELALNKGCKILSGHIVQDHVHMIISIPLKYSVAETVGYLKGKGAITSLVAVKEVLVAKSFGQVLKNNDCVV